MSSTHTRISSAVALADIASRTAVAPSGRVHFRRRARNASFLRCAPGFTLIELLVVVAIIALLLSILLPALKGAREQAKQAVCLANQKTLALSFVQYAGEYKDAVLSSWTYKPDYPGSWVDAPKFENGRYLNDNELRDNPDVTAEQRGIMDGALFPYAKVVGVYHCPSDRRNTRRPEHGEIAYRTYSMPNFLNGDPGWETSIGGKKVARLVPQIRRTADAFAFIEESDPRGYNMGSWVMYLNREQWIDILTVWHNNKSTIGFVDGHAIVHAWLDKRTIHRTEDQTFWDDAKNNPDYQYLRARWSIQE